VGFKPELFDIAADPEELNDLASDAGYADVLVHMLKQLKLICDPDAVDAQAKADQAALIKRYGGRDAAHQVGSSSATPVKT
jgi:choline-sulfatase